jgi:hypothetical protein
MYRVTEVYMRNALGREYTRRLVMKSVSSIDYIGSAFQALQKSSDYGLKLKIKFHREKLKGTKIIYTNSDTNNYYESKVNARFFFQDDYGETLFAFPFDPSPSKQQKKLLTVGKQKLKRIAKLRAEVLQLEREYRELDERYDVLEQDFIKLA